MRINIWSDPRLQISCWSNKRGLNILNDPKLQIFSWWWNKGGDPTSTIWCLHSLPDDPTAGLSFITKLFEFSPFVHIYSSQFLHFFHRFRGLKIRLRAGQSAIGRANVINAFFVFTFQSGDQNQIPSHPEGEVCLWIALCFIYNFVVISSNKSLSIIW